MDVFEFFSQDDRCAACGAKFIASNYFPGYGRESDADGAAKICYHCCGVGDAGRMMRDGKMYGYFGTGETGHRFCNCPETLSFNCSTSTFRHPWTRAKGHAFTFIGPDGLEWHGRHAAEWSQCATATRRQFDPLNPEHVQIECNGLRGGIRTAARYGWTVADRVVIHRAYTLCDVSLYGLTGQGEDCPDLESAWRHMLAGRKGGFVPWNTWAHDPAHGYVRTRPFNPASVIVDLYDYGVDAYVTLSDSTTRRGVSSGGDKDALWLAALGGWIVDWRGRETIRRLPDLQIPPEEMRPRDLTLEATRPGHATRIGDLAPSVVAYLRDCAALGCRVGRASHGRIVWAE